MHKIIFIISLCFFSQIALVQANDFHLSIQKALELSANQQVQSQKLAKVYLALCNNIMEPTFYQERDLAIETFDEQLHQLSLFTPTDNIKAQIKQVRTIWQAYKKIAGWSIKKDAASKLLKQSTSILQATKALHAAYVEYEKEQTTAIENSDLITINQYIKQNNNQLILIQRIMLYYLAEKQGIDATASGHHLNDAQKAFSRILGILEKSKVTSKSIQANLAFIRENWLEINQHLIFVDKDQSYVDDMLNRSKLISTTIKKISENYQKLGVKLNISYTLNESTNQSMHIQKIAKAYVASINDHISYKYKKAVIEHVDDFEKKMNSMLLTAQNDDIKEAIRVVKTLWKNYKNLVSDFDSMDELKAIKVLEQSHVIMAACDRVSEKIERHALQIPAYKILNEKDGHPVDASLNIALQMRTSANLRTYSQRLALYFMMTALDLDRTLSEKRLKTTLSDFEHSHALLSNSRLNSPAMRVLLESCLTEWNWIQEASKNPQIEEIDQMLEHSSFLAKKLSKLTNLYEHKMNHFFAEDIQEESPAAQAPSKN